MVHYSIYEWGIDWCSSCGVRSFGIWVLNRTSMLVWWIFFSHRKRKKKAKSISSVILCKFHWWSLLWSLGVLCLLNNHFHGVACPHSASWSMHGHRQRWHLLRPRARLSFLDIFQGKKYFSLDSRRKSLCKTTQKQRSKFCYFEGFTYVCANLCPLLWAPAGYCSMELLCFRLSSKCAPKAQEVTS